MISDSFNKRYAWCNIDHDVFYHKIVQHIIAFHDKIVNWLRMPFNRYVKVKLMRDCSNHVLYFLMLHLSNISLQLRVQNSAFRGCRIVINCDNKEFSNMSLIELSFVYIKEKSRKMGEWNQKNEKKKLTEKFWMKKSTRALDDSKPTLSG